MSFSIMTIVVKE